MRYALYLILATVLTIIGCGSIQQETEPAEPADSGSDAPTCTLGESCSAMIGCGCHIIDDCGCVPSDPQCAYYTCLSDVDGSQCLNGHECSAGHCAVVPFFAGGTCGDAGVCDGKGECVAGPDAGACTCSPLAVEPTIYFTNSDCTSQLLLMHGAADAGTIGTACTGGASWDVSGTIEPATLAPLLKTPQQWYFRHGSVCSAQSSALDIGLSAGDVVAVGTVRAPCM